MRMLEHSPSESVSTPRETSPEVKQRRRMLAALAMLLIALIVVVYRNHQYFYTPTAASEQEPAATTSSTQSQTSATASSGASTRATDATAKSNSRSRTASRSKGNVEPTPTAPPPPVVDRAVLPALQVEVVAGDSHRTVQPGNSAIKVDMQPGDASSDKLPGDREREGVSAAVDASDRVRLSPDASQLVAHQVTPNYPLLAKQMKVQGAVVLQALIGKEGSIQELQVLSGPTILSSAAREAVKQWRFKPYLQSGEPVETQAKITVNFTISTY